MVFEVQEANSKEGDLDGSGLIIGGKDGHNKEALLSNESDLGVGGASQSQSSSPTMTAAGVLIQPGMGSKRAHSRK